MNYILNETTPQFFLDEKFDLCERFILNEAGNATDTGKKPETVKEWAIETKDTLSRAYKALEGNNDKANDNKEADLNKIFNYISSLKNLINQKLDPSKLKPKVIEFIEKFKTLLASVAGTENNFDWPKLKAYLGVSPAVTSFVSALEKTVDMAKSNSYTKETIDELRTQVNTIYDLSKKFIAEYSAKDTTEESKLIDINKFKDACTKFILCCDVIEKLDEKHTKGAHKDFMEIASWINTKEKWLIVKKEENPNWAKDTQYVTTFNELIKRLTEFNNKWLKDMQQLAKSYDIGMDDVAKAIDTKDWDKTYKNWAKDTKSQEEFWNLYFKTAWGSNAQKVAYLGEAFRQELTTWGFKEEHNPFINFVKTYVVKDGYNITGDKYEKLHNAVVYNQITREELQNKGNKFLNLIIFNRSLYNHSAKDIEEYLLAHYSIKTRDGDLNFNPLDEIIEALGTTTDAARTDKKYILAAIMFGNLKYPKSTKPGILGDCTEEKINDIQDVNALVAEMLGNDWAGKSKEASNKALDKYGQSLASTYINDPQKGIKRLACIYDIFIRNYVTDSQEIDKLRKNYKIKANLDTDAEAVRVAQKLTAGMSIEEVVKNSDPIDVNVRLEALTDFAKAGNISQGRAEEALGNVIKAGGIFEATGA